jgi:hypothetical protein
VKDAVPAATSTLPPVTLPETFISGSNPGKALDPAIKQLKVPLAAPAAPNRTPKPNCENGVTPSTLPLPPPLAIVGEAAEASPLAASATTAMMMTAASRLMMSGYRRSCPTRFC